MLMRRADGWILLSALVALLLFGALFRYAGRTEEIFPLKRIATASGGTLDEGGYRIDINAADAALLSTLPGIGETLAERIVEYREQNGPFSSVDRLTDVPGIGEGKVSAIRMFVEAQ
ncbi:MAG: helix-hairpin-helix domain-containing protein [Clostridiales bacterium]|nr:helix-hairpin-helix domain-containing protein [Clostridiales bacterium]